MLGVSLSDEFVFSFVVKRALPFEDISETIQKAMRLYDIPHITSEVNDEVMTVITVGVTKRKVLNAMYMCNGFHLVQLDSSTFAILHEVLEFLIE